MILQAAKEYKEEQRIELEKLMIDKFEKMLEKCTEKEERTPWIIQNECILWEDMFFSISIGIIMRVFFCSKCGARRTIGFTMSNRETLLRTINSAEVCPCAASTLEDHIYEIAQEAVNETYN